ncbi:hypothetical protein BU15DRAFT_82986 [Melanogaster broomeanus]|nr:hypothetical protein BU15DRAFT_82986 [Melanogaster broomeanus]
MEPSISGTVKLIRAKGMKLAGVSADKTAHRWATNPGHGIGDPLQHEDLVRVLRRQKRLDLLSNEMRVFFCKYYNVPLYVKVEKLDVMVRLANDNNVDALLNELKDSTAISTESAAERCVNVLLDLIATRVSYVVQEAVVVMKGCGLSESQDIFRNGEYGEKIDNADELLNTFVDTFTEESYQVQLQTLTAVTAPVTPTPAL